MRKGLFFLMIGVICTITSGCGTKMPEASSLEESLMEETEGNNIVVGFSQLGAESDWRTANTESMRTAFSEENGYELLFDDAQQKQENQFRAIRNFILQEVDYIVVAPVTETGWETVLQEAKDAGIPVIIVDRMVDVSDDSLFTAWVGSDFELEGKKACEWLNVFTRAKGIAPEELNIVNIQGTMGASSQIGRTASLEEAAQKYGWNLLAQESGDYAQTKAQELMKSFLQRYENVNVVYCENDNEAFGAIEAIEDAGKKAGEDIAGGEILVMSFDATNTGLMETLKGKIAVNTECNPLHGPRVESIIKALEAKEDVEKQAYVEEVIFSASGAVARISVGDKEYPVERLTEEVLVNRAY